MQGRRVVVTGVGCVSPLGLSIPENWEALVNGVSGIAPIQCFDASGYTVRFAGEVKNFDITNWLQSKNAKRFDYFILYGLAAAHEAMHQAFNNDFSGIDFERFGICAGSGIGGLTTIECNINRHFSGQKISPFYVPGSIINMLSGALSMQFGLLGPNVAPTSACTTGTHAISWASRMIAYGDCDYILAGSAEKACTPSGIEGFQAARALSRQNDMPTKASRPWDVDRDGFVLSDGAGMLVLESLEHAQARGANILAEIVGIGYSSDAFHLTAPPEDGNGAARCMQVAIQDADIRAEDIDYINAHGTSTPAGDIAEVRAIKHVFQKHADTVLISSTKSISGHLLGAAGAVEIIYSILALQNQIAPPTINLDNPSAECDLNFVPHNAVQSNLEYAMSNSFGFGGTNGTVILKRWH